MKKNIVVLCLSVYTFASAKNVLAVEPSVGEIPAIASNAQKAKKKKKKALVIGVSVGAAAVLAAIAVGVLKRNRVTVHPVLPTSDELNKSQTSVGTHAPILDLPDAEIKMALHDNDYQISRKTAVKLKVCLADPAATVDDYKRILTLFKELFADTAFTFKSMVFDDVSRSFFKIYETTSDEELKKLWIDLMRAATHTGSPNNDAERVQVLVQYFHNKSQAPEVFNALGIAFR